MNMKWVMAALAALSIAVPVKAADDAQAAGTTTNPTMADLATTYNVQESELVSLRDRGWSWREIGDALAIGKRANKPLNDVVAKKDSGEGWDQISNDYGFKFHDVSKEAKRIAKEGSKADKGRKRGQAIQRGYHGGTETPNTNGTGNEENGTPQSEQNRGDMQNKPNQETGSPNGVQNPRP